MNEVEVLYSDSGEPCIKLSVVRAMVAGLHNNLAQIEQDAVRAQEQPPQLQVPQAPQYAPQHAPPQYFRPQAPAPRMQPRVPAQELPPPPPPPYEPDAQEVFEPELPEELQPAPKPKAAPKPTDKLPLWEE